MIPARVPIFMATTATDLRLGFDGLAAAARTALGGDPQSGALFLFFNRRKDRLKVLWYDRTGFCLLYKRLERGVFRIPGPLHAGDTSVTIDAHELARILEGVALPPGRLQLRAA